MLYVTRHFLNVAVMIPLVAAASGDAASSPAGNGKDVWPFVVNVGLLVAAILSAAAAWYSATLARQSAATAEKALQPAKESAEAAQRSAMVAERTLEATTIRLLVPMQRNVTRSFPGALPVDESLKVELDFYNIGQQLVELGFPRVSCEQGNAFRIEKHEFAVSSENAQQFITSDTDAPVPPRGATKVTLWLRFSQEVAQSGGGCNGSLRFPVKPPLSDGRKWIDVGCEFNAYTN